MNMNVNKTKLRRKEQKYYKILRNDTGVATATSSRFVMVCNIGLVSGYTEDEIFNIFSRCGILGVFMVPMKSYCFVEFENESVAKHAVEQIHGKYLPDTNTVLYLLIIEKIPDVYNPFNTDVKPNGLYVCENFITDKEENELMNIANCSFFQITHSENVLKHRQVQHFGYEFYYDNNSVCKDKPLLNKLPKECDFVMNRLKESIYPAIVKEWSPNQLTINHYDPGQGIPPHIDSHDSFDDIILSLSLGSDIIMDFKSGSNYIPILLRRRSLMIMSGESRLQWSHGIASRKFDVVPGSNGLTLQKRQKRISYTFRNIRNGSCNCSDCNNNHSEQSSLLFDGSLAAELEKLHVHTVYDKIAEHFSETRQKPWPNIATFINSLEPASVLADIGCANGRFFGINSSIFQIGCDISAGLCTICASKGHEVFVCNCLRLPYRTGCVDACISIAVIHHLSTPKRRMKAVQEMIRILKYGGEALVYVWAKEQRKNNLASSYLKQNFRKSNKSNKLKTENDFENVGRSTNEVKSDVMQLNNGTNRLKSGEIDVPSSKFTFPIHTNRTEFNYNDMFVKWKVKSVNRTADNDNRRLNNEGEAEQRKEPTYLRFYHVFSQGELENLCLSASKEIEIVRSYYDEGNWCVILRKVQVS